MLTVALWPGGSGCDSLDLLGKPVWTRTLAAARGIGPGRTLWLGRSLRGAPAEMEVVEAKDLSGLRDTVLVVSAELPCLTQATLRDLLQRVRSRPHALLEPGVGRARVVAARASDWKRALAGTPSPRLEQALQRLAPALLPPREPDELLMVETAEAWSRAASVLRSRKTEALLARGVLLSNPANVLVDPEVSVGAGTRLAPWVHLEGTTVVGRDCIIGSFTHIVDSVLGAGAVVHDHCFIRSSRIGKNVQIGPFAHLRPDSRLGPGAKVGNFVELKNTRLGPGAKAPHLSYLGDAVIGKGTNVGAGTITCNFDGVSKHRTLVGDHAFIGSDVQLVAPVRVGKGAYIGAGSCIIEDVPAFALAIARSRQTVKPGWAKRRRRRKSARNGPGRKEAAAPKARERGNPAALSARAPRKKG